jgi:hypothetical protein
MASTDQVTLAHTHFPSLLITSTAKKALGVTLVVGGSLVLAAVILLTNGDMVAGLAFLGVLTVALVTFYRVDWGFNIFIFMVFFFDQYGVRGFSSFTDQVGYFLNVNNIYYLPPIREAVITPMELQLLLVLFVWVFVAALRKNVHLYTVPLKFPAALFYIAFVSSIMYGMARGGDFVASMWETRALFYLGIMFIFVPQVIQTKRQLQNLIWFCVAGITFKALQGAIRFASLGFSFGSWPNVYETLTNHEDPVFIITLFVLLMAMLLFHSSSHQRRVLLWLSPLLLLGFVAGQRRATYASFIVTILAFLILIPKRERQKVLRILILVVAVFGVYLAAFWNSYSRLGSVAQQFKSTVTGGGNIRGEYKDEMSIQYRTDENYNLSYTFKLAPLVGRGFGVAYERPLLPWGSSFALSDYLPHNQILWVFVKMGVIGGMLFWLFFNSFVFRGAMVLARLKDSYLKAVCAVCVVAVVNQFVVSYVDMQLAWYRNMVYLGLLMGLVPVLERLDGLSGAREPTKTEESFFTPQ